jgi:hypothetical protein
VRPAPVGLDWMARCAVVVSWGTFLALHQNLLGICLFAGALVCAGIGGRFSIHRTVWLVFSLVALVLCLTVLKTSPVSASGLVYPTLFPIAVALGLSLYPALLRRHTLREYWASLVLSNLMFLICGLNLAPVTAEFAALSALWTLFFCLSVHRVSTGRRPSFAALVTILPSTLLLAAIALAFQFSERQVNALLRLLSSAADVSIGFPAQSRLNTMLNSESNPAVVCRVYAKKPNTYLPARVYTDYVDCTWKEPEGSSHLKGVPQGERFRYVFNAQPALVEEQIEVNASPIVAFAPRDAAYLDINLPEIHQLSGHLLELRGGGNDRQVFTVGRRPDENLAPPESAAYLELCRRTQKLNPVIVEQARQQMGEGPPLVRAKRLESWLQDSFQYGFGYDYAASNDPVGDFLTKKPPGHCEVFATAMTLMLRSQGIPCRYVNGFVVVERSFDGEYFIVRVRDAHAWVEMWEPGQGWVTLDPTPPAALQNETGFMNWFDGFREMISHKMRKLTAGGPKQWFGWLWSKRKWLGLLLLGLALWKARKLPWLPAAWRGKKPGAVVQSEWVRRLAAALAPHGLDREAWETLHHWADRVAAWEHGAELAEWLRAYSAFRYGGGTADQEQRLGSELQALLQTLPAPTRPQSRPK